jgi:hypothetical protein
MTLDSRPAAILARNFDDRGRNRVALKTLVVRLFNGDRAVASDVRYRGLLNKAKLLPKPASDLAIEFSLSIQKSLDFVQKIAIDQSWGKAKGRELQQPTWEAI